MTLCSKAPSEKKHKLKDVLLYNRIQIEGQKFIQLNRNIILLKLLSKTIFLCHFITFLCVVIMYKSVYNFRINSAEHLLCTGRYEQQMLCKLDI